MNNVITANDEKIKTFFECSKKNIDKLEKIILEHRPFLLGKRFITDAQLSERIGLSRRTLQDYRDRRIIPYYRLDGKVLYEENDVEKFLNSLYVPKY